MCILRGAGLLPPSWPSREARAADYARSGIPFVLPSVGLMQNLLSSVALTISVGILAVLAQWSRKNRMAEISLLFLGGGLLLGIVWASGQMPADVYPQKMLAISAIPIATAGLIGLALCAPTLVKIVGRKPNGEFWTDPPVFLALWLFATVLLANNLIGIIGFEQLTQVDAF